MILEKQARALYRQRLFVRHDNPDGIRYLTPEDFPGLMTHEWDFRSPMGHPLKGCFYHYPDPVPGRIVVFDHGMGNGHRAYMAELEQLCRMGFLVYSYDHTGCMASGGSDINGFAQSLNDLDTCLKALKALPALSGRSFSVVGHSWGGFSTMNIAALHPDVTHVVGLSGFVSVEAIVRQSLAGPLAPWVNTVLDLERQLNPGYAELDAAFTLANTEARVLLIYSGDDQTIHKAWHYDALAAALAHKEHVELVLLSGRDHNPTYSDRGLAYKKEFQAALAREKEKKTLTPAFMDRWDWRRMNEQDAAVWKRIEDHLKK